jgi:glutamyl-tRNA synthetase
MPLEGETTVSDMVRGSITVQNEQMQDLVLLKSDGYPTYHLANVIDDHFMEISHIIRAEEWISTAPVHSQLYTAFGWQMPHIAHVPVILKQSGKGKMSKRDEGASISYFQENGYLPETVTNFLCNVGWNYGLKDENGEEIQIFSKEQAAEIFDITRVSTSGTKFDLVKLQWLNGEYIRRMDVLELAKRLRGPLENAGYEVNLDVLLRVTPLIQERIKTLNEVVEKAGFFFSEEFTTPPATALVPKKMTPEQTANALQKVYDTLINLPDFTTHTLENALRPLTEELSLKPGELFGAIRIAVIGQPVSPPLFESMDIMGRDVCISRIASAIEVLHGAKVQ